jgi:hypothetical protein
MKDERCGLCGELIDLTDPDVDVVQVHAGPQGGFIHDTCLQESAEDLVDAERRQA